MEYEEIDLLDLIQNEVKDGKFNFDAIVDFINCSNRILYLGDIVEGVGSAMDSMIRFWNEQDEKNEIPIEERTPIRIYVDSNGGSLVETFTMIDSISMSKTPVYTICTGAAYSGGFFTFIAGHKRFAYPLSSFLYHEGSTGNTGDAGKFRNFAAFYDKILKQLKDVTIKYTNITEEEYDKHIKDDWWFTAEEALEFGICDKICEELI